VGPAPATDDVPRDADVCVLAWTRISARQSDLAQQLGGDTKIVYPEGRASNNKVVRYLLSAKETVAFLRHAAYGVLIVTAPPVETAMLCALFRRRSKPFILDSHPGAFGLSGDTHSERLQFLHRWLWRKAECVLVTTPELADLVGRGGGRGLVFHEPPPPWSTQEFASISGEQESETRSRVCVPFIFTRDEPVDTLVAAARLIPSVEFRVTGNPDRLPTTIEIPENVTLLGFLDSKQFLQEMHDADAILVLSTEPQSVMRTAYEAVRLERPLIVSDTAATRRYFPHAVHTATTGHAIFESVQQLMAEPVPTRKDRTALALAISTQTTDGQMAELRERIAASGS